MARGICERRLDDTPIAIIDFETTGLTPGADRVVEVAVARVDAQGDVRLVFDTLVNPMRRVSATEIHGITDADVADAPRFADIANSLGRSTTVSSRPTTSISTSNFSMWSCSMLAWTTSRRICA